MSTNAKAAMRAATQPTGHPHPLLTEPAREHPAGALAPEHTTLTFDEGMIAYRTTPIESELRDLDSTPHWGDATGLPWLAAEVVIHAEEPSYGRQTQVWLTYGVHTGELSPAQGREALAAMREFADRYERLLDYADQVAVTPPARCPAAHPEDPTPCGGPVAVTVLDAHNGGADGCELHAARLLASLDGGRVVALPDAPDGAAVRTFKAAGGLRPFPWREAGR